MTVKVHQMGRDCVQVLAHQASEKANKKETSREKEKEKEKDT